MSNSSTTTITRTIELPEELADRLAAALGPDGVHAFAVAVLEDATADLEAEPDAETVASMRIGFAQAQAGELLTPDEADAMINAAFATLNTTDGRAAAGGR